MIIQLGAHTFQLLFNFIIKILVHFFISFFTLSKALIKSSLLTGAINDCTIKTDIGFKSMCIALRSFIKLQLLLFHFLQGSKIKSPGLLKFFMYSATTLFHTCFCKISMHSKMSFFCCLFLCDYFCR